jgi:hypothetical protein
MSIQSHAFVPLLFEPKCQITLFIRRLSIFFQNRPGRQAQIVVYLFVVIAWSDFWL